MDNPPSTSRTDTRDFATLGIESFNRPLRAVRTNSRIEKQKHRASQRKADAINFWPSGPPDPFVARAPNHESWERIWQTILSKEARQNSDFMRVYCSFDRPPSLDKVMSWRRTWSSWSYEGAYPSFSKFLKLAERAQKSRCNMSIEDFDLSKDLAEQYRFPDSAVGGRDPDDLWENIKHRPMWEKSNLPEIATATTRLMQIIDLSPMVLTCIVGSTPRLDVSYVANFIDRHLKFTNWGKVNLLQLRNMGWSSYTFEYHFSFYYVSRDYSDTESVRSDLRDWRKSAPIGRERQGRTRHIHEETLSFLLIGHFGDICTCIQLEEAYYKDPYAKDLGARSFRPFDSNQPSAMLFLSWIAVALHHVSWRWQSAIDAVDSEITFPGEVVFTENRNVLMTDDPKFSHAKTYFFALQAYKLFEQTLNDTIDTWRDFKQGSLPKLWHSKIDRKEWAIKVQNIDAGIAQLERKIDRIKERTEYVKDLREGLASTSALFDSRTALRQGDNIRLLTYVNLLFLPLSFGTSIFGMQIMGNSDRAIRAFAIALPSILIGTIFLIMNLNNILDAWESATGGTALWLLQQMRTHRRRDWKQRAVEIGEDWDTYPPVPRARRKTGGLVYSRFILETLFVGIPTWEVLAAREYYLYTLENIKFRRSIDTSINNIEDGPVDQMSEGALATVRKMAVRERAKMIRDENDKRDQGRQEWGKRTRMLVWSLVGLCFALFRIALLPIWLLLLVVEYLGLVVYLELTPKHDYKPALTSSQVPLKSQNLSSWLRACHTLGLDFMLPESANNPATLMQNTSKEDLTPGKILRAIGKRARIDGIKTKKKIARTSTDKSRRSVKASKEGPKTELPSVQEGQEVDERNGEKAEPLPSRPLSRVSVVDSVATTRASSQL